MKEESMQQDIILDEIEEFDDIEQEKKKKSLLLVVTVVLAVVVYWVCYGPQKQSADSVSQSSIVGSKLAVAQDTTVPVELQKSVVEKKSAVANQKSAPATDNSLEVSKSVAKKVTSLPVLRPAVVNKLKPTDKSMLIKAALANAGKVDPFSDGARPAALHNSLRMPNIASVPPVSFVPPSYKISPLPMLKGVPQLPLLNVPGLSVPQQVASGPELEVKGFLGDKVIVSFNGETEALSVNQKFRGIRVLSIDPSGLKAKFAYNSSVINKKITQ